ncbi:coiled-coil domain-containing protein 97 isoform X2 [Hyperolius riggenbachi]|uniref:coiled-coil domain-containing protein 97 isoform X2 n=1 Tax=Hyperolius riggenbachi TaxID=752182 RepID=UPI0035A2F229
MRVLPVIQRKLHWRTKMAASTGDSPGFLGSSESEQEVKNEGAEEEKKVIADDQERTDQKPENGKSLWGELPDTGGEDKKGLRETLKVARLLECRTELKIQHQSDATGTLLAKFTITNQSCDPIQSQQTGNGQENTDEEPETDRPLWGEIVNTNSGDSEVLEGALKEAKRLGSREDPIIQGPSDVNGPLLDLFSAVCQSRVPIRSQQIGEPEFSREQKMTMLLDLYKTRPLIFLERFHKVLKEEHLPCFSDLSGDYTADFYFKEIRKASLKKVNHTRVRNKRYAALQQLISDGEYFSDEQMRQRDPLMYEHYVGQYLSEEEIMSLNSKEMSEASSLSEVLLSSCQEQTLQRKLEIQRELEENCEEEEESGTEEEESELQSEEEPAVDSEERALMREEFVSRMHQRFLDGKDKHFDYSEVDDNPDFDNLDIVTRDEEERYFDDDDGDDDDDDNDDDNDDDEDEEKMEEEGERGDNGQTVDNTE